MDPSFGWPSISPVQPRKCSLPIPSRRNQRSRSRSICLHFRLRFLPHRFFFSPVCRCFFPHPFRNLSRLRCCGSLRLWASPLVFSRSQDGFLAVCIVKSWRRLFLYGSISFRSVFLGFPSLFRLSFFVLFFVFQFLSQSGPNPLLPRLFL